MNKKELAELKKNFDDKCGFFTFNRILRAFVDSDKNVIFKKHSLLGVLPSEEQELITVTLRKGLSGTLGKNLVEYNFPDCEYEEDGAQHILYDILKTKFENDEHTEAFLNNITKNIEYTSTFAIISAHCTYTMFRKDKNDELSEDNSDYNFILTVLCPAEIGEDVLVFDDDANNICLIPKKDRVVSRTPTDAFLFPVLTCGDPDINAVMCYSSKPKEPNKSLVKDVLGCETTFTAQGEKEVFGKVLHDIVGKDLDYTLITTINDKIAEEVKEHRFDSKPTTIDDIKLKDILSESGVDEQKLEKVHKVYSETVGQKPLTASNLVSTKTVVATPDITINIGKSATEKVRTSLIGGRRCLVIDLDDPNIIINGLPTTVELATSQTFGADEPAKAKTDAAEAPAEITSEEEDYAAF
ncbi:MAG: DUF4317 domain-containing protein [Ruminiclostridium sp.]|nr:DUF4317 domain-containing protein [Ruminiclostridium sp.]